MCSCGKFDVFLFRANDDAFFWDDNSDMVFMQLRDCNKVDDM